MRAGFVSSLVVAAMISVGFGALASPASAFRYCGSFSYTGKKIGVNSERVYCGQARRVARRAVQGGSLSPFDCRRGAMQGNVMTYRCTASGGRRVYVYNAGYGE